MRFEILSVDQRLPEGQVEQVWFYVDRRNSASVQRCNFPNSALVERHIKALIANRPDIRVALDDFYFVHVADEVQCHDGDDLVCYLKSISNQEIKEFKDYAS